MGCHAPFGMSTQWQPNQIHHLDDFHQKGSDYISLFVSLAHIFSIESAYAETVQARDLEG